MVLPELNGTIYHTLAVFTVIVLYIYLVGLIEAENIPLVDRPRG